MTTDNETTWRTDYREAGRLVKSRQIWRRKSDGFTTTVKETFSWPFNGRVRVYLSNGQRRSEMWADNLVKNYELVEVFSG